MIAYAMRNNLNVSSCEGFSDACRGVVLLTLHAGVIQPSVVERYGLEAG